jgi:hypothetical protein
MARFTYNGEPARAGLVLGPALAIIMHTKAGARERIDAPNQTTGFVVGQDMGINVTDSRVLRHMRHDKRFTEITVAPMPSPSPTP